MLKEEFWSKEGFKENYGSYFVIALFGIVLICFLILLLSGKYHLLSVLELLYNSNIKSMNYLKNVSQNNQEHTTHLTQYLAKAKSQPRQNQLYNQLNSFLFQHQTT